MMPGDLNLSNQMNSMNFRQHPVMENPQLFGGHQSLSTPAGLVHTQQTLQPPPLPPRPSYGGMNNMASMPSQGFMGMGNYNSGFGMGGYDSGYGGGLFNSGGYGSYGGSYGGFGNSGYYGRSMNNYNYMDPETRFIQMAEESSRPAFQSIGSIVGTIGNIADMLNSTYFALTSSFRAILGVAANFSKLRGFFAQFLSTFTLFRSIMWMYRKLLYSAGLSRIDPQTMDLKEAFLEAEQGQIPANEANKLFENTSKSSGWPMICFMGFILFAPYLITKLYGSISETAVEDAQNPTKWVQPISAVMLYDFAGNQPTELRVKAGQHIQIAPKEIQQTSQLLSTSWLLATADNRTSGLIPANYIKRIGALPLQQPPPVVQMPTAAPQMEPTEQQNEKMFAELSEELGFAEPDEMRVNEAVLVD